MMPNTIFHIGPSEKQIFVLSLEQILSGIRSGKVKLGRQRLENKYNMYFMQYMKK